MWEADNRSNMNITTAQNFCAECNIGWLATDGGNVVFECNEASFTNFIAVVAVGLIWVGPKFLSFGNVSIMGTFLIVPLIVGAFAGFALLAGVVDLSIGSILVFTAMVMGLLQAEWLPSMLGSVDSAYLSPVDAGRVAGLTVDAAFNRVARELGRAYPELGDEFALTAIELSFLSERRQAFENLAARVNLDAVKGVTTTMIQTERYGTPLASALRVLSAEFRNERMMRAEEKAARLPAIMTVPLILFILPVLFVVILGPAACSIADAFSGGGPAKGAE